MLDPMGMSTHSGETKGVKRESVPPSYVPPPDENKSVLKALGAQLTNFVGTRKPASLDSIVGKPSTALTTMSLLDNKHDEDTPNAATIKDVVAQRDPITGEIHYIHNTHTRTNTIPQQGIDKNMLMYTAIGVVALLLING